MNKHYHIIIAGAGGIAEAVGLILSEWSSVTPTIYIGNRTFAKAQKVANWIQEGTSKQCTVMPFHLEANTLTEEMKAIFNKADALLDCLPGHLAPKMAQYAKNFELHYANLTEYVAETNQIMDIAKNAKTGFVLQTGLAPGYINVLANHLFQKFCEIYKVDLVDSLEFKVGALTKHAVAPHYYGFTWSPIGVATEYVKDAIALRNYKKVMLPALSEPSIIIINGVTYEDDLTSGGAANLPDELEGKVRTLDYKTLRHPGHYDWVKAELDDLKNSPDMITDLQNRMMDNIPNIEEDQIVIYAAVQGNDDKCRLRRQEIAKVIHPQQVGKHMRRAIQTTTAVPLIQAMQWLLETAPKGVILQSDMDPETFLNGDYIVPIYGKI